MIFLKPLDEQIMREVAELGKPVITVEDGTVEGGLGSAVLEWLADNGVSLEVKRLGVPDRFIPHGTPAQQHRMCGFDARGIFEALASLNAKPSSEP